ncbi:hypothetical protein GCM10010981_39910 [Dyella nitratireducens]|uniref:NADPH-dependent FMN reductase n=1 Tax=Dyella nitratireducens TaxID=1849580 RepID=A0ABQ1GN10_9GAMM|nr:hypothetical protein GCM10010981_39910 [Dyella nitratireducens]GLQ41493.1 hypothetical protein GCM10007902_13430 [Dyella nitratireducens]
MIVLVFGGKRYVFTQSGISIGATGTGLAQQHLRNILVYLDVPLLGQPEVFLKFSDGLIDDDGNVGVESTKKFLQGFVDRYVEWVRRHSHA